MASAEVIDDENDLETLLAKATNPLHREPEPESLSAFCNLVEKELDGPQTALRLLAHKIQSPQEKESLMALSVLEESVKNCGIKFRSEVGKFRFLNEMIKVVSPKYLGNRASLKVKQKIIELMFLWSMDLKQETKIFEAYQMLKRQGVVTEDPIHILENYEPPQPPAPRPKNAIFEDEEKAQQLQKLLRSKNPEDLQAANRLIKNMVREADRRMELLAKRSTELETVHNNANVLADMLEHYRPGETSAEEKDLMKELFESCERLRPKLFRLAGELDEKDDGLGDILKANDELTIVINRYKKTMGLGTETFDDASVTESYSFKNVASLLDLGSPIQEVTPRSSDSSLLDDQLLALGLNDPPSEGPQVTGVPSASSNTNSSLTDLDKIFTTGEGLTNAEVQTTFLITKPTTSLFTAGLQSMPLTVGSTSVIDTGFTNRASYAQSVSAAVSLKPVQTSSISSSTNLNQQTKTVNPSTVSKGLEDLDELGQSLLKKSLPSNSTVKVEFPSTPQKIPLSQLKLQQEQQQNQKLTSDAVSSSNILPKDGTTFTSAILGSIASQVQKGSSTPSSPAHEVLSLRDLYVPLETIQPGILPSLTLHEKNGLTVVIHFGKNIPRPDVSVMVVSSMSKNSSPVKNVSFQAAVPKSMKIRLQPPSATDLPPHNPILPPAAITQVMLLANPLKEKVRLKYKVNYSVNMEEFSDIGEVEGLFSSR